MPLRESGAFQEWIKAYEPSYAVGHNVEEWLSTLGDASYQAPSVPWTDPSDPTAHYRNATLPPHNTFIFYFVEIAERVGESDDVDLLWIGPLDEAGGLVQ